MNLTKNLLALVAATALFVLLLDQIVPRAPRTPAAFSQEMTADIDRGLSQAADERLVEEGRRRLRAENNPSGQAPDGPHSALTALLAAHGLACPKLAGVVPIKAGEGIFELRCLSAGGALTRYRVDTRKGMAAPA